jgi:hypothetical protein
MMLLRPLLDRQNYTKIHKIWRFTGFDFLDYQGFSVRIFPKPIVIGYKKTTPSDVGVA